MKKKIFFVMNSNIASGAEKVNFTIINELKKEYDFYWISRSGEINEYLEERNINWIEIKKLNYKEIKRVVEQYKPDILHATDYKASFICSLFKDKVKIISHLHNNSPWIKKICINSFIFLYTGMHVNKILTVSQSIEKEYIFSKLIQKKIICIGNPIDRAKILKNINNLENKKEYDICCVARTTKAKNPFRFIKIIEKLKENNPNIKAIWVGKGELLDKCREKVNSLHLQNNIDFLGFKNNPYEYINKSKIFMLTSSWEGYGLVAFEAITLGVPAFVSKVGGLVDIVDDTCGKLCDNDEDFLLCNELLKNQSTYNKYSFNAIKKSKEIENLNTYMEQLKKIYEEVLL